jgi:hypothetical protein
MRARVAVTDRGDKQQFPPQLSEETIFYAGFDDTDVSTNVQT